MNDLDHNLTVQEFSQWWLKHKIIRPPFLDGIFYTDIAASLILFRNGPFQVELYISKPDTEAPFHSHPGVDSVLMYLTGNMNFGLDYKVNDYSDLQKPHEKYKDSHCMLGKHIFLKDGDPHNLITKKEGGAFFSFEKWKERIPTSVTVNWEGDPTGELHKLAIKKAEV
jgi:hypothetical protein